MDRKLSDSLAIGRGFQASKWSVAAQYELHLPKTATLTPRLDYVFSSRILTNANDDSNSFLPGYDLLNGRFAARK